MYGSVLCGWRPHWIEGPGVSPRVNQCNYRTLLKGWADVQRRKIQDHDMPAREDSRRDVRGGLQSEEHRRGGPLTGSASEDASHVRTLGWS